MEKKNILITGSTGFIGRKLVTQLVKDHSNEFKIYCGVRETSDRSYLEKFSVKFRLLDLDNPKTYGSAVKDMDIVVHLAANFDFHAKKESLLKFNVDASVSLAQECITENVEHFVYCSSTEALGVVQNASENAEYHPDDNYGLSKQLAEQALLDLQNVHGLPLTIARPSGVYGPGDTYVFAEIVKALELGVIKAIPGSGKTTIHFTFIDDIVQGFIKIIRQPDESMGEIFNIACDEPQTYNQIIETICKELDKQPPRFHVPVLFAKIGMPVMSFYYKLRGIDLFPLRANAVQKMTSSRSYDNTKIKNVLGFQTTVSFTVGVKKAISWLSQEEYLTL